MKILLKRCTQAKHAGAAVKRFFGRLRRSHGSATRKIVTDKLLSYDVSCPELVSGSIRDKFRYGHNGVE
jgi:transposase-like protein